MVSSTPMELTKEQRIARHKHFLKANVELIASFSWGGNLASGRGAVLVPEDDFVHAEPPQLKGIRFHYLPLATHDQEPFKGILSEQELGWLTSYDPDVKVVVCILRPEGGVSSYLIGGRMKPSEAWARQQAKRN
jgi:hypothetical protein